MLKTSRFLNLTKPDEKSEYADIVWEILRKSYIDAGGFKSADSPEHLVEDSHLWKLSRKGGEIVACVIYKQKYGRKAIAAGTDGTSVGKQQLVEVLKEDYHRAWLECSGKLETMLMRNGGDKYLVPARYAQKLTGKDCTPLEDGYHYSRLIQGTPMVKVIIGTPQGIQIDRDVENQKAAKVARTLYNLVR